MTARALTFLALGAITFIALTGCGRRASHHPPEVVVIAKDAKHAGHCPPPHAPAHGYRHKLKDDVALTYDADLGVYVVVDTPHAFYYAAKTLYYRLRGSTWEVSVSLKGDWRPISDRELPGRLASAGKTHGKGAKKKHEVAESGR